MKRTFLTLAMALWLTLVIGGAGNAGQPPAKTTLTTPRFTLQFAADGRPLSFKTREDDRELLNTGDPGQGFYLSCRNGATVRFEKLCLLDGKLVASCYDGLPRVTFAIHEAPTYLSLKIERLEAVPAAPEYSLHFQMNLRQSVRLMELDYMTEIGEPNPPPGGQVLVDWNHLWNRNPQNPRGGFAIYCPRDEADEDETILTIWVNEGLPHPRVAGQWDLAAARAWIKRWLDQHGDQSRFWISARTPEELYAAVPYAQAAAVRDVYLFTDTWRGGDEEVFWAVKNANWHINRGVFPRGEQDLRAFSDYLRARGMNLKLHWISGGIGLEDPLYVGKSPDPRLASWGGGRLVGKVDPGDTTLYFRPDPGVEMPFRVSDSVWAQHYNKAPTFHPIFDYEMMAIGGEVLKVGAFSDTDREVWRLERCERGLLTTDAASHQDGAAMRGLISAYRRNLMPDNDSTLLGEMARNFAQMLNRCGVSHTEYDGAEIHTYNGRMWGFNKFASLVYSNLDHPVTALSSSGNTPPCYIEYRLNATRHAWRDRQKGIVAIMLDQPFRPASSLLDAHWGLSQMCAHGYSIYNIMKPEPLFGVNIAELKAHGLTMTLLETARNWKRANQLVTPDQRKRIRTTMFMEPDALNQAGKHEQSGLVHELVKGTGQWEIFPTRVMSRPGQVDINWQDGQEHGAISPRQFVRPGQTLRLVNPFKPQPPRLVLRVLWGNQHTPGAAVATRGQETDNRGADWAFEYDKMQGFTNDGRTSAGNILLQPQLGELRNLRDTHISAEGPTLVFAAENPLDRPLWEENNLPEWSRKLNMLHHRAISMWVTGDGSGAVLTLQIPGGDYVVPIDFTGRRYIEIPNAQVAWAQGGWGWRMGSKHAHYDKVNWLKLGFGMLPAKSKTRVRVEGLTALREFATELRNPVLHVGDTRLAVKGAIASGQYLTWEGGPNGTVFDANWNRVAELPVAAAGFSAPTGEADCRLEADPGDGPQPWLELQLLTRDAPLVIPDPELRGKS